MKGTYHAHFTAGALLQEETERVLRKFEEKNMLDFTDQPIKVNPNWTGINSEKGRITTAREIGRRMNAIPHRDVWSNYLNFSDPEQKLILYYSCCKAYGLVLDFHLEVILEKWRSFQREIDPLDFLNFLDRKSLNHPEMESWTANTQKKLAQVCLKMLKQADILRDGVLKKVPASSSFWRNFVEMGDSWFLELMFLNEEERESIIAQ